MVKAKPKAKGKETVVTEDKPLTVAETKEVKVIEKVFESHSIAPQDAFGKLTRQQVDLIKRTIAQGASDDELKLFIQVCKGAKLNPFLRQAHLVPFWDSKSGVERRAVIIGIDGFRAIAEGGGQYAGSDDAVFEDGGTVKIEKWEGKGSQRKAVGHEEVEVPKKATVTVWKMLDHQRVSFTASARWNEYYPGGKKGARWHVMPYLMLGKCAEALALRKAFPLLLSGMYEEAEFSRQEKAADDQKRVATAFDKLMMVAQKATVAELEQFKGKIEKSDKYTEAQKIDFRQFADKRIEELQAVGA